MPKLNGLELCQAMRAEPEGDLTVIFIVTAKDSDSDLQAILQAGADDYLLKPINRSHMEIRLQIAANLVVNKQKRRESLISLRNSEREYRRLFEDSPVAMIIHAQGSFQQANAAACRLLGVESQDELFRISIPDLVHPDDLPEYKKRMEILATGKADKVPLIPLRLYTVQGQELHVLVQGLRVTFEAKYAVMTVAIDVTEKMQAEQNIQILSTAIEQSPVSVLITDPKGNILYTNPKFSEVTGYTPQEVKGQNPRILKSGVQSDEVYQNLWQSITQGKEWHGELCNLKKDGRHIWEYTSISPIRDHQGEIIRFMALKENITERKEHEEALKESEERYALASIGANDGLWDWQIKEKIVYLSPRWKALLGYADHELENSMDEWYKRIHPDDLPKFKRNLEDHLNGLTAHFEVECRVQHRVKSWRWISARGIALRDDNNEPYRMAGSIRDITARKEAEEKLLHDAFYDVLTELPNKKLFLDRLQATLARGKRHKDYYIGVIYVDIDRLNVINESLGHETGDQVVKIIGERLQECIRNGDTLARISGDAFGAILDDLSDFSDASYVVKRMQQEISKPITLNNRNLLVTSSIGISINTTGEETPEELLRFANIAMNNVKREGRNSYRKYQNEMDERAKQRLEMENRLFQAIKNDELFVVYQPQVNSLNGDIIGFEALLRWNNPQLGLVSPVQFIPLAEESGIIIQLGEWTLNRACRDIHDWNKKFGRDFKVSVNFSPRQFQQTNVVQYIDTVLNRFQLESKCIEVEITESTVMQNIDDTIAKLNQLKEKGILLSIDDFGTGYSSLSYLKQLPLDVLKIDKSFVQSIPRDSNNMAIVNAIISLAKSLDLNLIAEGVETFEQLSYLKANNCNIIQGFYFSKPLGKQEMTALIQDNNFEHKAQGPS
jgi:diguanylate cyclase (GGDEF)-like protein/PAS domain S-box-containing protein